MNVHSKKKTHEKNDVTRFTVKPTIIILTLSISNNLHRFLVKVKDFLRRNLKVLAFVDGRSYSLFCSNIFYLCDPGARLPNVTILLPTEKKQIDIDEREKTLKLSGR